MAHGTKNMALKILRMIKNNWKKLVMLKKTMLLFFMPLLINCLIKIILKIRMFRSMLNFNLLYKFVFFQRKKIKRSH